MKTIYKYPLLYTGEQEVSLPADSQILKVAEQGEYLMLWAEHDAKPREYEIRRIRMVGTGFSYPDDLMFYLGTVFSRAGLVWHFFELLNEESASDA